MVAEKSADRVPLPRLESHGCFACGTANPIGLHLTFFREGEAVVSEVTLSSSFMGYDRIAHGGIVSTLLDELMSYAVIAFERRYFVTREMRVRYRRPVPLETPLRVEGRIRVPGDERSCHTVARILDEAGEVLAEGDAEMRFLPADKLGLVSAELRDDMERLFAAMRELDRSP